MFHSLSLAHLVPISRWEQEPVLFLSAKTVKQVVAYLTSVGTVNLGTDKETYREEIIPTLLPGRKSLLLTGFCTYDKSKGLGHYEVISLLENKKSPSYGSLYLVLTLSSARQW